jgi:imidazolonepropionase-like amidohydrolase
VPAGPVAFTDVRAFVGGDHFAEHQNVIVEHGIITAVGPAASVGVPRGATIFEGRGKTLVPGLWDSHMHVGDDLYRAVRALARRHLGARSGQ